MLSVEPRTYGGAGAPREGRATGWVGRQPRELSTAYGLVQTKLEASSMLPDPLYAASCG